MPRHQPPPILDGFRMIRQQLAADRRGGLDFAAAWPRALTSAREFDRRHRAFSQVESLSFNLTDTADAWESAYNRTPPRPEHAAVGRIFAGLANLEDFEREPGSAPEPAIW
jgi:hypothetical protein